MLIASMIVFKSPFINTFSKPSSYANQIACRFANTSTISIEVGSGICCDKATITNMLSFQIITSSPVVFSPSKTASSKLTLYGNTN